MDCIHEAGRILVIDPEECIDCFAPDETLITSYGVKTFAELENQACRILTDDGFRPALVKRFRRKPLVRIELAPAFEERDRYGGTRLHHAEYLPLPPHRPRDPDAQLGARGRAADGHARGGAVRAVDARRAESQR